MPNGMPSWEEWNEQLTNEQRQYSLYKVLADLDKRELIRDELCSTRLIVCDGRFKVLEKRKWLDRGSAVAGGFVSGLLGALGIKWGG